MAESTRYQRVRLNIQSPWNYEGETSELWSLVFSLSGATSLAPADIEPTVLDLWQPVGTLVRSHSSLVSWQYYDIGATTAGAEGSYAPGVHAGDASAYEGNGPMQQLEVCALAECPVGKSIKGKPVFLRKWIHDTQSIVGDGNTIMGNVGDSTIFRKWDNGCGPRLLVPVSPTTGIQGGPWTLKTHLFTHQMRKGQKRKKIPAPNPILSPAGLAAA